MNAKYPGTIGRVQGAKNIKTPAKKAAGTSSRGSSGVIAVLYYGTHLSQK